MLDRKFIVAVLLMLLLAGMALLSMYLVAPPKALPADAPATGFSATRAMQHVRQVARAPHAMGTAEHARVRAYLVAELQKLGLQPQVQQTTAVNQNSEAASAGHVYNILARLKGTGKGKALLLMAHYDSQPNTPGAGDDASGVAAILETLRALKTTSPLQNDVIIALTDGEEYGLFGARAFMQHPWAKEVGFVINMEARGNKGPSFTFEISPQNGWVMKEFAKAAPYPIAGSVMYEVYKRMPNDTDFSVMREAGISGVNSAMIGGFVNYHSPTDTPENLDPNSLQHHGSNALALVKHFGNISLNNTKAPDKVFFNPAGKWLVQYPVELNFLWIGILTLLLLVTWRLGLRRNAIRGWRVVGAAIVFLLITAVVSGVSMQLNTFVKAQMPYFTAGGGTYNTDFFFLAYLLLAFGLYLLFCWLALRWFRVLELAMGACLVWFILTAAVQVLVPSATYILLFPLLFCLAGLLLVLRTKLHEAQSTWKYNGLLLLAAVPAVFMLAPIVYLLFIVFDLNFLVAMVLLLVLLSGLLLPVLIQINKGSIWKNLPVLPLTLLILGAGLLVMAMQKERPSTAQPERSQLNYYLNADTDKALWASGDLKPDSWTKTFFKREAKTEPLTTIYPIASRQYLQQKAQTIKLPAPVAILQQDSVASGQQRYLKLKLYSPRQAQHLEIILQPEQQDTLTEVKLNGQLCALKPIETTDGKAYYLKLLGLPVNKEAELEVRLTKGRDLNLILYDQSIGLPQELFHAKRPAQVIPAQGGASNITVVRKSYRF